MTQFNTTRINSGNNESLIMKLIKIKNNYQARLEYTNHNNNQRLVLVGGPDVSDWKAVNNAISFANLQLKNSNIDDPTTLTSGIWKSFFDSKQPELF